MNALEITVQAGSAYGANVSAEIISVEGDTETIHRIVSLGIPLLVDDLAEGSYLVRVRLPNGGLLSSSAKVTAGQTTLVALEAERYSPNESGGWGYVLQSARRRATPEAVQNLASTARYFAKAFTSDEVDGLRSSLRPQWRLTKLTGSGGEEVASTLMWPLAQGSLGVDYFNEQLDASRDPNAVCQMRLQLPERMRSFLAVADLPGQPSGAGDMLASFLHLSESTLSTLISLPPQTEQVILVRDGVPTGENPPQPISDSPWNVVARFADPHAMALFAYLGRGDYQQARLVGADYMNHAVSLLAGKFHDHTSAVIAGYYLLKTTPATSDPDVPIGSISAGDFTQWLTNLDHEFPMSSDGAVINATQHLRCGRLREARERLIETYRRGLPSFTMGARMLVDGLKLLATDESERTDEEVTEVLRQLQPFAASVDWEMALTTLRGILLQADDSVEPESYRLLPLATVMEVAAAAQSTKASPETFPSLLQGALSRLTARATQPAVTPPQEA